MGVITTKVKTLLTTTKRGSIFVTKIRGNKFVEGSPKDSSGDSTILDELCDQCVSDR